MTQETKYSTLRGAILADVQAGVYRAGEQLPGERILASRYGVAHMTMRQAISMLVDEGVLRREPRVGTFLRSPAEGKREPESAYSKAVVLLPRTGGRRTSPVQHGVLEAVFETVSKAGYSTEVQYFDSDMALVARLDDCRGMSGVMLVVWYVDSPAARESVRQLRTRQVPVVLIDSHLGEICDFVTTDNHAGTRALLSYLHGLGHRRLTYLTLPPNGSSLHERREGTLLAARDLGLQCQVVEVSPLHYAGELPELLRSQVREGVELVFACNDQLALDCLKTAGQIGLAVPQTLSLAGFDDIDISAPLQLTTVAQDFWEMGQVAAGLLLRRIARGQEGGAPAAVRLLPELRVRNSCRPARVAVSVA